MIQEIDNRISEEPNDHGIYSAKVAYELKPDYSIKKKIALVDADLLDGGTRHPNLVIMKLAGYFKEKGCDVKLIEDYSELMVEVPEWPAMNSYTGVNDYDAIYISKVFDFTHVDRGLLNFSNVFFGGTGFFFDHAPSLPYEIEHHMPDYTIYNDFIEHDKKHKNKTTYFKDYLYFSIGFATRGCFRQCKFCVNHACKTIEFHSHIKEWLDPSRKYIYLWDDNILGYPKWRDVLEELKATGKPFQFRQGMDMRLMTAEKAEVLNSCKYYGDYIFAFDHPEDAPIIEKKLTLWRKYCSKSTKLYVLAGFDGIDEKEITSVFERIRILLKYGCYPYIMRHENYLKSPYKGLFIQIARWCNQPQFLKKLSFREYCYQCQKYHKSPGYGAPMRALVEFEEKFPEIAREYFDIKFEEQPYVIEQKRLLAEKNAAQSDR